MLSLSSSICSIFFLREREGKGKRKKRERREEKEKREKRKKKGREEKEKFFFGKPHTKKISKKKKEKPSRPIELVNS